MPTRRVNAQKIVPSTSYSVIAKIATEDVIQSTTDDPVCKRYPEIAILGYSNGGHAALYAAKKLGEMGIIVDKLFLIDPIPWFGECALKEECNFFKPANVEEAIAFSEQVDPRFPFPWSQRGRRLLNGNSNILIGWTPIEPIEEFHEGCHADTPWPENAHNKILCDASMIGTAVDFLSDLDFKDDYMWGGTVGRIMNCDQFLFPPICFVKNDCTPFTNAYNSGDINLEQAVGGLDYCFKSNEQA